MASCLSMGAMFCNRGIINFNGPSASLSLLTGSKTRTSISLKAHSNSGIFLASAVFFPIFFFRLFIFSDQHRASA
ncbi:hypothetical protein CASFOL_031517 [Castilleja foliolosa]|uniref:Uncharacterized protein n=1 Tax=Castilleja foliolosa TaxID=1961234 RepID=A0ABD3C6A6_9LAMI